MSREYRCDRCGKRMGNHWSVTAYAHDKDGTARLFKRMYDMDRSFVLCDGCFEWLRDNMEYHVGKGYWL